MHRKRTRLRPGDLLLRPRNPVGDLPGDLAGFCVLAHGPRQSSLHISAERPAKFQLRPKARILLLSDLATMISGAIQYSEFVITVSLSRSLPAIGVTAPSMIFGIWKMRVLSRVS